MIEALEMAIPQRFPKLIKEVIRYAAPISLAGVVNIVVNFIAMVFVAQLGKIELAASALGTSTFYALVTFGTTSTYAISILCGKYHAQGDVEKVGKITLYGMIGAVVFGLVLGAIIWNIAPVLLLFKQNPILINIAIPYFHYAALTMTLFLYYSVITQFFTGISKPGWQLNITLVRMPITICLAYALVLGKWGFPQMGLAGVMAALLYMQIILCVGLTFFVLYKKSLQKYKIFQKITLKDMVYLKKIAFLGLPIGVQFSGEIVAMTIGTYLMGWFGVNSLAALQIVGQYAVIIVLLTLGFAQAASILISRCEDGLAKSWRIVMAAYIPLAILYIFVAYFFVFQPKLLMHIFLQSNHPVNAEVFHYLKYFFMISAQLIFVDAMRNILASAMRGLHDSKTPMWVGLGSIWFISLPAAYIIGIVFNTGPIGMRAGFLSGFIIAVILLSAILTRRVSQHRAIKSSESS